jgi:hypothetical protein
MSFRLFLILASAGGIALLLGIIGIQTYRLGVSEDRLETTQRELTFTQSELAGARNAIRELERDSRNTASRNSTAQTGREAIVSLPEGEDSGVGSDLWKALKMADEIGGLQ